MAATTITRSTWTDGASGTILDNAALGTDVYDRVDALFTAAFTFGDLVHAEGAGTHQWYGGTTGAQIFNLQNTTAGTAARTIVRLGNDASVNCANFTMHSTSYTTSGPNIQDGALVACSRAGGLALAATNASGAVKLYAAGTTKVSTFDGDRHEITGATSGTYSLNGVITGSVNTTTVGTDADTVEKDLHTFTVPGGTLATDGQMIRFRAGGTFSANANNKTVRVYFGASEIGTAVARAYNDGRWSLDVSIIRTGAATQKAGGYRVTSSAANSDAECIYGTAAETLSGDVVVKVTGQNGTATASDVDCEWSYVEVVG